METTATTNRSSISSRSRSGHRRNSGCTEAVSVAKTPTPSMNLASLLESNACLFQLIVMHPQGLPSFLSLQEIGRVCLLTSKRLQTASFNAVRVFGSTNVVEGDRKQETNNNNNNNNNDTAGATENNNFWFQLCLNQYQGNSDAVSKMIQNTKLSAKKCFLVFLAPELLPFYTAAELNNEVEDDYWIRNQFSDDDDDDTDDTANYFQSNYRSQPVLEPPPPPLKYVPSDYVLVVQVWATRGIYQDDEDNYTVLVLSETIDGGSIPNFFFNGECSITLPYQFTPIVRTFFWRYRVSYRLLRKPDTKVILLSKHDITDTVPNKLCQNGGPIEFNIEEFSSWIRYIYPEAQWKQLYLKFDLIYKEMNDAVVDDDEDAKKDETRISISHSNTNTNNISNRKKRHCDGTHKTAPSHRIVGFRIYPLLFGEHDANGKNPFLRWDTNLTFSHFIEKLTVWNDN